MKTRWQDERQGIRSKLHFSDSFVEIRLSYLLDNTLGLIVFSIVSIGVLHQAMGAFGFIAGPILVIFIVQACRFKRRLTEFFPIVICVSGPPLRVGDYRTVILASKIERIIVRENRNRDPTEDFKKFQIYLVLQEVATALLIYQSVRYSKAVSVADEITEWLRSRDVKEFVTEFETTEGNSKTRNGRI